MEESPYRELSRRERQIMDALYRLGSATAAPETGNVWDDREKIVQAAWTSTATNKLLLEAGMSSFNSRWGGYIPAGIANGLIPVERGADCRLSLEVQSFFLARGAGAVEVALAGHVRCMDPAEAVVAQAVAARAAVSARGESVPQVVAAFQQALDEATTQLLQQAGEIIAAP